jgi:hypothetical protein
LAADNWIERWAALAFGPFKEWDTNPDAYNKSRYALRRTIKQAKRQYKTNIKSYYTSSDADVVVLANFHGLQRDTQPGVVQ